MPIISQESRPGTRGFTLIELLLVIAIVAVISLVVILTLNPAEILRQTRDSTRISDMATLRSSVSLYLATVATPALVSSTGGYGSCYTSFATGTCGFGFSSSYFSPSSTSSPRIDSTGWLPIDFTQIPSGPPVSSLPIDPVNNGSYFYSYAATSTTTSFKLVVAGMESRKYGPNGSNDVAQKDGGSFPNAYESGNLLGL